MIGFKTLTFRISNGLRQGFEVAEFASADACLLGISRDVARCEY